MFLTFVWLIYYERQIFKGNTRHFIYNFCKFLITGTVAFLSILTGEFNSLGTYSVSGYMVYFLSKS